MSGSVNKCIIVGNLGRDPEIRSTNSGDKIANLSVATSETWKDKNTGDKCRRTEWHRVVVFNDHLVKVIEQYCRKGTKVYVEGALQTRKWQDQSGTDRYSTEIVLQKFRGELTLLDSKQESQKQESYGGNKDLSAAGGAGPRGMDDEDIIPFAPLRELP